MNFKNLFQGHAKPEVKSGRRVFSTYGAPVKLYQKISIAEIFSFYENVSPLSNAIDMISNGAAGIPIVEKSKDGSIDYDTEATKIINRPGSNLTRQEFINDIVKNYSLTGNAFIIATGSVNSMPKEMMSISPKSVNPQGERTDGLPREYIVTTGGYVEVFKANEVGTDIRYWSGSDREFYHILDFQSDKRGSQYLGQSRLNSLYQEMSQFIRTNIHNRSTLEHGARPSGLVSVEFGLDKEEMDSVRAQFRNEYSGEDNVGKTILVEGDIDYKELAKSNKEMDYLNNKKDLRTEIYTRLKVPLPLVSAENMTMDNFSQSELVLFRNAILPTLDKMLLNVTKIIYRGGKGGKKENTSMLTYTEDDIPTMKAQNTKTTVDQYASKIITLNEARTQIGREEMEGGDVIYFQANQVPMGFDRYTADLLNEPAPDGKSNVLRNAMNRKGERIYSEEDIAAIEDRGHQ